MKASRPTIGAIAAISLAVALAYTTKVNSQTAATEARSAFDNKTRRERLTPQGAVIDPERPSTTTTLARPTEAPAGFDNLTNGYLPQGPKFDSIDGESIENGSLQLGTFNVNRFVFEEVEGIADGLGPTYNAQSCGECHQNVVTGGASQVAEHRTGHIKDGVFYESVGGSLVHSRATNPDIVERVNYTDEVRTFRISTNTLGDGFVECISNSTLLAIQALQPAPLRGSAVAVKVLEAPVDSTRLGRFGWKNQHASLKSFAADAYLNEMGITSPLFPEENTSSGRSVATYDPVADPEDDGADVDAFADFMRATKAPSRGPITASVRAGEGIFNQIGCGICHVSTIVTAPPGTKINGAQFVVPAALGNKIIHPYSDFLLHDVGTGDGIPILPTAAFASTANQIRTAPLWALRTRNRLMHDGLTFTPQEAILRHAGQAATVTARYNALTQAQRNQLVDFLNSL